MRIRHIVLTDSFAGAEQHVCVLANEQARSGHQVEVWGGSALTMRERLAPDVAHRPSSTVATAVRGLRDSGGVDIVHAHMTKSELAALLTTPAGTPVITTRHFATVRGQSLVGHLGRPILRRRITRQIAVSRFVASRIDGMSTVVYAGVPSDVTAPRERQNTVLVAQRLSSEKQTADALGAFAASALAADGWQLDIAGRGRMLDELKGHAARLGIADHVNFLGFTPDLPCRMVRAAILLATAPAEPFGLTVAEAMSHGTPVVATASGGHLETVGRVGVEHLYDPGDTAAAGEQLRRLADDEPLRLQYGAELRNVQQAWFTPGRQSLETQAVYEEAART